MKKLILWYTSFFLLFSLVYFFLFHTPLFTSQTVLFYRGIMLLTTVSAIGLAVGLYLSLKLKLIRLETLIATVIMAASIHLAVFVVFPVTFDRSVTMYLLNDLRKYETANCGGLPKEKLQENLIAEYVKKDDAIGRRIKEQAVTDFVRQDKTCVSLTPKGNDFLNFSEIVKKIYGVK